MCSSKANHHHPLTPAEIQQLQQQGCRAAPDNWQQVSVCEPFRADRVWRCCFVGVVKIGRLDDPSPQPAHLPGLYDATIEDCTLGDFVRVSQVRVRLAHYDVGDSTVIEDVGLVETRPGAQFGNGIEVEVLNEGGGREVILCDSLSAQVAYLLCLYRYRPQLVERLRDLLAAEANRARSDRGHIGPHCLLRSCPSIVDVRVGPAAVIEGATRLVNGSILSHPDAPTRIGAAVIADDFIVAEGAEVNGGAQISTSYIGQATRVGRQFSAENCLWFANGEAFHGEACSVWAGPFTVTHHKSTLLIAGLFSFYNAGSGTNQSNHMYKLGPLHEGRLERGSKTGSFSYMMWPCRVGPFSVVLGKHTRAFDASDFPFSYLEATADGKCALVPGFNLTTVGTMRDGAKWPARDRRPESLKRDHVSMDVLSPLTVQRMIDGLDLLAHLQAQTDRSMPTVSVHGVEIKRVFLRTGQKFYRRAIQMYVAGCVVDRLANWAGDDNASISDRLRVDATACHSRHWVDLGGMLVSQARLNQLLHSIESGCVKSVEDLQAQLAAMAAAKPVDRWAWIADAADQLWQVDLAAAIPNQLAQIIDVYQKTRTEFLEAVLVDAGKEFDESSRIGFGTDGQPQAAEHDFHHVRGDFDTNKFVGKLRKEIDQVAAQTAQLKERLVSRAS